MPKHKQPKRNKHSGSSFGNFLRDEGIYDEVTTVAWKRVLCWQITEVMKMRDISKTEMARRMNTSRTQLERLLDPDNTNILLETVQKAATAIGKQITITLVDAPRAAA